jgi:hypothetical protein
MIQAGARPLWRHPYREMREVPEEMREVPEKQIASIFTLAKMGDVHL